MQGRLNAIRFCSQLVSFQVVSVVNVPTVYDFDAIFLGASRSPGTDAIVGIIVIFSDEIAVAVVDIEVKVGVAVAINGNAGSLTADEHNIVYIIVISEYAVVSGFGATFGTGYCRKSAQDGSCKKE